MCCLSIGHFVRARTSFSRLIALETGCCQSICCQQEIITFSTSIRIERISNEALCLKRVAVGIPSRRDITKLNTAKATLLSHTPHVESTNSCSSTSYANGGDLRSLLLELVEHGCLTIKSLHEPRLIRPPHPPLSLSYSADFKLPRIKLHNHGSIRP
jgi:hypothetical protein